ncbi:hypothetical protein ACHHYP_20683 [Achlya hypogyna]|uniref:Uncharacterized protein n=1 Tax=Achlya hypogyna TaxID=1202772 RepID=A0A1V9YF26_ACHHY|nr:hypothetical protein ACHHYP_20683 [Achlya hypogyna]
MNWFRDPGKALYKVAKDGKESEVARLLRKGAPLEWTDRIGNENIVRQLLAAGANVHHEGQVRHLEAGARLQTGWNRWTVLDIVAYYGDVAIARHVLIAGAEVIAVSEFGQTARDIAKENNVQAATSGDITRVRNLLATGFDASALNDVCLRLHFCPPELSSRVERHRCWPRLPKDMMRLWNCC